MARRHHYKRTKEQVELDVTTFLNLMVVLIPFLLITAVFSRITIQELNVPAQSVGGHKPDKPLVTIEVVIRKNELQMTDGEKVTADMKKIDGKYDIAALSKRLADLKEQYPQKQDAVILVEPDIEYDDVIRVMDAVKSEQVENPGLGDFTRVSLFPKLSLGDAP